MPPAAIFFVTSNINVAVMEAGAVAAHAEINKVLRYNHLDSSYRDAYVYFLWAIGMRVPSGGGTWSEEGDPRGVEYPPLHDPGNCCCSAA